METILHGRLFSTFLTNRPKPIPDGSGSENERWIALWNFLHSGSDLKIYHTDDLNDYDTWLYNLTTGREGADVHLYKSGIPFSCHNQVVKWDNPHTFFCLNEPDENNRKKYRHKNGYLFAFEDDLLSTWDKLRIKPLKQKFSVRKDIGVESNKFTSWSILQQYLTPFSDAVIIDGYIFSDPSLIESNIEKILIELDKATHVKYNLSIVSFIGYDKSIIDGKGTYEKLREIKQRLNLKFELELILLTGEIKEHDRGIYTNYLKIGSGDSFNYFLSNREIVTKGTDISFRSMADKDERVAALTTLAAVSMKIEEKRKKEAGIQNSKQSFGRCKNRLFTYAEEFMQKQK